MGDGFRLWVGSGSIKGMTSLLTANVLWNQASLGDVDARVKVAYDVNTPGELLHELTMDRAPAVVRFALCNPNVWESDLIAAVKAGKGHMIMGNPALTGEFIEWAYDVSTNIRRTVMPQPQKDAGWENQFFAHKNCSREFMEKGVHGRLNDVRRSVAGNVSLPKDLVEVLVHDSYMWTLRTLIHNPSVEDSALYPLLQQRDIRLLKALAKRFSGDDRQRAVNRIGEVSVRSMVANRSVAQYTNDPEKLSRLAYSPDVKVRKFVAKNPATRAEDRVAVALLGTV